MSILVVDDSRTIRISIKSILNNGGYNEVILAESALDAFQRLGIKPGGAPPGPDIKIILMDIVMPDVNGIAACRVIKSVKHLRDIPVIMMTSLNEKAIMKDAFDAGATDFITKPINDIELLARIGTALELKQEMDRRIQREQELLEANRKLQELDQMKSDFLSNVTHELRTPLTSVLGFSKMIKKRLEELILPEIKTDDKKLLRAINQVKDNLDIIIEEGVRLTSLINDVLDIAKMEAGKIESKMEQTSLAEIIERAAVATASLFEQKKLSFFSDIQEGLPSIMGDRDRLIQTVINLLSNAVKFTERGSVTCRARVAGDEVIVCVIDTGVGIAPEDMDKVFEKFKQVGDTLTEKPKGTGLGLPICKEIIELHGGRIWVESKVGAGSIFSFALPLTVGKGADA